MNEERDKLIQELHNIEVKTPDGMQTKRIGSLVKYWHLKAIANFIIADRKRIVKPILDWEPDFKLSSHDNALILIEARNETLKRAVVK